MPANKTITTSASVSDFIAALPNDQRRNDSMELLQIFESVTGFEPKMFGPTIIGFGNYHYKYASGREGDAPLAAFAPRKDALVLYVESEFQDKEQLLQKLGKFTISKVCIYVRKLEDIDIDVLKELIIRSVKCTKQKYPD